MMAVMHGMLRNALEWECANAKTFFACQAGEDVSGIFLFF